MINLSDKNATRLTPVKKTYDIEWQKISFESWKLWLLINWAVTITDENDNVLFVSTGFKEEWLNEKADFFPLVVDWQEKFYATGKIGWNRFQKREARPSDEATLTARLIDRPIRPMFPKWIINDTQVIATVLSSSGEKELWFLWITGASMGLMMAWTPFEWPVAGCKISMLEDWSYIFNPSSIEEKWAKLTLLTAWTLDAITMVEAWASEVSDEDMVKALEKSHEIIKHICNSQIDFVNEYREVFWIAEAKAYFNVPDVSLYDLVKDYLSEEKMEVLYNKWKKEFQKALNTLDVEVKEHLLSKWYSFDSNFENEEMIVDENSIWAMVYKRVKEVMRKNILDHEKRLDGRKIDEVREVIWEVWLLPRTHGSALFQRWMTQSLSITTLGWPDDVQTLDWMMPESEKRYLHHYNFPPYSVWEVRMMRWVGRREIGHWALAERALLPVLPSEDEFPYTIRVVSEITTCNWSSSMASVCWSTMSLMHAWVPIKSPVAWVAMWMIYDEETWKYKILSDIQAQEDFLWDMDFKVARTAKWITAMQLDVKIKWLKMDVFREAFKQSNGAVEYILWEMLKVQSAPNEKLSKYAPLILSLQIPVDKIRTVIWKWWENVQRMEKEHSIRISIADDWVATITSETQEWWEKVINEIKELLWVPEVGYKWKWKVVKIIDWTGAIVEFRWKSWMIHVSKLSYKRIEKVEEVLNLWDDVDFEIIQVDLDKWRVWLKRELTETEKEEQKKHEEQKAKKIEVVKKEDNKEEKKD